MTAIAGTPNDPQGPCIHARGPIDGAPVCACDGSHAPPRPRSQPVCARGRGTFGPNPAPVRMRRSFNRMHAKCLNGTQLLSSPCGGLPTNSPMIAGARRNVYLANLPRWPILTRIMASNASISIPRCPVLSTSLFLGVLHSASAPRSPKRSHQGIPFWGLAALHRSTSI
jgi:hypothetical protein